MSIQIVSSSTTLMNTDEMLSWATREVAHINSDGCVPFLARQKGLAVVFVSDSEEPETREAVETAFKEAGLNPEAEFEAATAQSFLVGWLFLTVQGVRAKLA